jgi:hypothetical protein
MSIHSEVKSGSNIGSSACSQGPFCTVMTALKPMGSTTAELAKMAYDFAKGGIDIIKDDHGLADQRQGAYTRSLFGSV